MLEQNGSLTESNISEVTISLQRINFLDERLQSLLVQKGVIQVPQGEMQVSEGGIGAQGPVEAPSAVDAMNMGTPPETANDKNPDGRM